MRLLYWTGGVFESAETTKRDVVCSTTRGRFNDHQFSVIHCGKEENEIHFLNSNLEIKKAIDLYYDMWGGGGCFFVLLLLFLAGTHSAEYLKFCIQRDLQIHYRLVRNLKKQIKSNTLKQVNPLPA